jgi:hypothetical protein
MFSALVVFDYPPQKKYPNFGVLIESAYQNSGIMLSLLLSALIPGVFSVQIDTHSTLFKTKCPRLFPTEIDLIGLFQDAPSAPEVCS